MYKGAEKVHVLDHKDFNKDIISNVDNAMVEIFDNRIEISGPGGLVKGLLEKDFGRKSILRNPKIAGLFHRTGYIEKMGTGIRRMHNIGMRNIVVHDYFNIDAEEIFNTCKEDIPKLAEVIQGAYRGNVNFHIFHAPTNKHTAT